MWDWLTIFMRGLFKSAAFVIAICVVAAVVALKPKLINWGVDVNLAAIKAVSERLPDWWGDVLEAGLRMINAERTFLFMEVVVVVKLIMLAITRPFRRSSAIA